MSEDRFKDAFARIVAETPDAPRFSDLEAHDVSSVRPAWLTPWVAAVGAALVVLVIIGVVGALGGGGPDLAQPDDGQIRYLRIVYQADAQAECAESEIVENGRFEEATIEIWGPSSDGLTMMIATFPDGTTEKSIVEGDPDLPDRAWGLDPSTFDQTTGFRTIQCRTSDPTSSFSGAVLLRPPYEAGFVPPFWFGPPSGFRTWEEALGTSFEVTKTEWAGYTVTKLSRTDIGGYTPGRPGAGTSMGGVQIYDFYVSPDNPAQLVGFRHEAKSNGVGIVTIEATVVETDLVPESEVDFSTDGLFFIAKPGAIEVDERDLCPVTIATPGFTPPDGYPASPSDPNLVWFGRDDLWTALPMYGEYQPRKSVWWSVYFPGGGEEPNPPILVTHRLLNAGREVSLFSDSPTNAYTDGDGWFMLATIDPNSGGCWEVTAIYKGASLTYVYYSEGPIDAEEFAVVPDVVGLEAAEAVAVLDMAGFATRFDDMAEPRDVVCAQYPEAGVESTPGYMVSMSTAPPGECHAGKSETYSSVYTDELGWDWYGTHCPEADVLLRREGSESDGLPQAIDTTLEHVNYVLAESGTTLTMPGIQSYEAIPRVGQVWDYDEDGNVIIYESDNDYMIRVTVDENFECPSEPFHWERIPVAFVLEDTE